MISSFVFYLNDPISIEVQIYSGNEEAWHMHGGNWCDGSNDIYGDRECEKHIYIYYMVIHMWPLISTIYIYLYSILPKTNKSTHWSSKPSYKPRNPKLQIHSYIILTLIWKLARILLYLMAAAAEPSSSSPLKITVQSNPSESQLSELGIKSWPK